MNLSPIDATESSSGEDTLRKSLSSSDPNCTIKKYFLRSFQWYILGHLISRIEQTMKLSKVHHEIVLKCFKNVALLSVIQDKYVSLEVFLDLVKYNYSDLTIIRDLSLTQFKKALCRLESGSMLIWKNEKKILY